MSDTVRETRSELRERRRIDAMRFAVLVATLLLATTVMMVFEPMMEHRYVVQVITTIPPLVGLWVALRNKRVVLLGLVAILTANLLGFLAYLRGDDALLVIDMGLRAVALSAICVWVAWEALREQSVSADTILGAIAVYLGLGFVFAILYMMCAIGWPDAFASTTSAVVLKEPGLHPFRTFPTLLYFSFCTLTTVGYGDIAPVLATPRLLSMLEGVAGQLFPAIFIARLVSLHIAQRRPAHHDP